MDKILSLRNVDAGFVVRGLLQSLAWAMATVMFGNRPRDAPDEGEAEVILTRFLLTTVQLYNFPSQECLGLSGAWALAK